jgi:hypothetical protein
MQSAPDDRANSGHLHVLIIDDTCGRTFVRCSRRPQPPLLATRSRPRSCGGYLAGHAKRKRSSKCSSKFRRGGLGNRTWIDTAGFTLTHPAYRPVRAVPTAPTRWRKG